jgi:hypothetical protein
MTPAGYLNRTTRILKRHAQAGDVDAFRAYVRSDEFADAIVGTGTSLRQVLLNRYAAYAALCEASTRYPLPKPQRRPTSRWLTDRARAQLAKAYAIAGDDHEKAGRILGCTAGAARLARKRYLDAGDVTSAAQWNGRSFSGTALTS